MLFHQAGLQISTPFLTVDVENGSTGRLEDTGVSWESPDMEFNQEMMSHFSL